MNNTIVSGWRVLPYLTLAPTLLDASPLQPASHTLTQGHGADEVGGWHLVEDRIGETTLIQTMAGEGRTPIILSLPHHHSEGRTSTTPPFSPCHTITVKKGPHHTTTVKEGPHHTSILSSTHHHSEGRTTLYLHSSLTTPPQ